LPSLLSFACGKDPAPAIARNVELHIYEYGTKVRFGSGGDSHRFCSSGWSQPEQRFRWTDGVAATLLVRVPATQGDVTLLMRLFGNIKPPELSWQPVHVYVNGQYLRTWAVSEERTHAVVIPARFAAGGGLLLIDLHIPLAISPAAMGGPPDDRRLGVACAEMEIDEGTSSAALAAEPPVPSEAPHPNWRNEEWHHSH
jgi:hypothetical protein